MRTVYKPIQKLHIKLKYKDAASEQLADIFHAAMRSICMAYPLDPLRRTDETIKMCKRCGGAFWEKPQGFISPKLLKTLAKQLGIKVIVESFLEKCTGELEDKVPNF